MRTIVSYWLLMPAAFALVLLLLLPTGPRSLLLHADAQTLVTYGATMNPLDTQWVEQMAFDATNSTLYLTSLGRQTVVSADAASFPWTFSVLAGISNSANLPTAEERRPFTATFHEPTGIVGWPSYAVGSLATTTGVKLNRTWVGLWICDRRNHAIRFINFRRGNNVTVVAGSTIAVGGYTDGIGYQALLNNPRNIAWGRFRIPWSVLLGDMTEPWDGSQRSSSENTVGVALMPPWTSVLFWSDVLGHCIRQGMPLHRRTLNTTLDEDVPLQDIVLNVTTFAGQCGNGGTDVGVAVKRMVLMQPWGLALVNPSVVLPRLSPSATSSSSPINNTTTAAGIQNSTSVLFVGEWGNRRVSMIAPMYPISSRVLVVVWRHTIAPILGVTLARIVPDDLMIGGSGGNRCHRIELFVAADTQMRNVTVWLEKETMNTTTAASSVLSVRAVQSQLLVTSSIMFVHSALIFQPRNVTMMSMTTTISSNIFLLVGGGFIPNPVTPSLQAYCCLNATLYEEDASTAPRYLSEDPFLHSDDGQEVQPNVHVTDTNTETETRGGWPLSRSRGSATGTRSQWPQPPPQSVGRQTGSAVTTFAASRHPLLPMRRMRQVSLSITSSPRRRSLNNNHRNSMASSDTNNSSQWLVTSAFTALEEPRRMVTSVAGVSTSVLSPNAANKVVIMRHLVAVYRCAVVGIAQVAAEDPQQFLSFGAALGEGDQGGVRAALILTACLRISVLVILLVVAARTAAAAAR